MLAEYKQVKVCNMKTITAGITITTHPYLTSYKAGTN